MKKQQNGRNRLSVIRKTLFKRVPSREGVLAQLVERLNGIEEVRGSNPLGSTDVEPRGFDPLRETRKKLPVSARGSCDSFLLHTCDTAGIPYPSKLRHH